MNKLYYLQIIGVKELKHLLKQPLFYIIILLVIVFTASGSNSLLVPPYDSQEAYEQRLGYLTYEQFHNIDYDIFYQMFLSTGRKIVEEDTFHVYEDKLTLKERIEMEVLQEKDKTEYYNLFTKYCESNKINDYGLLTFEQLQNLTKEDYEKICHSLYVPEFSRNLLFFAYAESDTTVTYPTYEEAVELAKKENMSSLIAREYYARLNMILGLCSSLIIILMFIRDFNAKVTQSLFASNVSGVTYILGKFITINLFLIFLYFIITILPAVIFIIVFKSSTNWVYQLSDFVIYYIAISAVTITFINALTCLIVICSRNLIFSVAGMFYYIFLFSEASDIVNGATIWKIGALGYTPRLPVRLGIIDSYATEFIIHQIGYLAGAILMVALSVWLWNRIRVKGGIFNVS